MTRACDSGAACGREFVCRRIAPVGAIRNSRFFFERSGEHLRSRSIRRIRYWPIVSILIGNLMRQQSSNTLLVACLLVAGYAVGRFHEAAPAHAATEAAGAGDFVVVPGYTNGQSPVQSRYYVVTNDGAARPVSLQGQTLYAPQESKLDVDVDLPSRIRFDHSGRITN